LAAVEAEKFIFGSAVGRQTTRPAGRLLSGGLEYHMGFLDKARDAAQQATTKAQKGLAQGQAKLGEVQTSRAADALLRDLGAACYAEQRSGGSHEGVVAALSALDAHVAANGPLGQAGSGPSEAAPL